MEHDEIVAFYNEIVELSNQGKEKEVQHLLATKFSQLPEDMQGEVLATLYANSTIKEAENNQIATEIREQAYAALDELDSMEKEVRERNSGT